MISRLALAAVAGTIAYLVCILIGMLLSAVGVPIAATIGAFITQWAMAIAILVAVAHFFGATP